MKTESIGADLTAPVPSGASKTALPPLPVAEYRPHFFGEDAPRNYYTAEQMHAYAAKCVGAATPGLSPITEDDLAWARGTKKE